MSHYRRLTMSELRALEAQHGLGPDATDLPGLVRVGTSGSDAICFALGDDGSSLPGRFMAEDLDSLHPSTRRNVARARWEPTGEEDPGFGSESTIPEGATVLESGIPPVTIA